MIVSVAGFASCPYHQKALHEAIQHFGPNQVQDRTFATRSLYKTWLLTKDNLNLPGSEHHTSSPFVWINDNTFIGGCDALLAKINDLKTPIQIVKWPNDTTTNSPISTTKFAKHILSSTIHPFNPTAAEAVLSETKFRDEYNTHYCNHVAASLTSKNAALKMAKTGLEIIYNNFQYGDGILLKDAMLTPKTNTFQHVIIEGKQRLPNQTTTTLRIPINGKTLHGEALLNHIKKFWTQKGTIDATAGDSIHSLLKHPENWSQERLDQHAFVVMGAGAAMGPALPLLKMGATVIAIDLDKRPETWHRLIQMTLESPGRLIVPVRTTCNIDVSDLNQIAEVAGANLLTDVPEIADWLIKTAVHYESLTIGSYAYLDGAKFVAISVAQDAIANTVLQNRSNISIAYLCTPTDVFPRSMKAREQSIARWQDRPLWMQMTPGIQQNIVTTLPIVGKDNGVEYDIVDCTVNQQGPNYLLAKRIQHWRSIIARENGATVSANVAPASFTESVTKVALLHGAYIGCTSFKPIEIFQPETSNHVMAAALVYDIFFQSSFANPNNYLSNPMELFSKGSWHGGMFTSATKINSIVVPAAVIGLSQQYSNYIAAIGIAGAAAWMGLGRSKL